jgi:hypothetical protein
MGNYTSDIATQRGLAENSVNEWQRDLRRLGHGQGKNSME